MQGKTSDMNNYIYSFVVCVFVLALGLGEAFGQVPDAATQDNATVEASINVFQPVSINPDNATLDFGNVIAGEDASVAPGSGASFTINGTLISGASVGIELSWTAPSNFGTINGTDWSWVPEVSANNTTLNTNNGSITIQPGDDSDGSVGVSVGGSTSVPPDASGNYQSTLDLTVQYTAI